MAPFWNDDQGNSFLQSPYGPTLLINKEFVPIFFQSIPEKKKLGLHL